MSSTKKVVIIFSAIFLASLIGIGVILGCFIGSIGNFSNFRDIFRARGFEVSESSDIDLEGVNAIRIEAASADIHVIPSNNAKAELKGTAVSETQENYLSVSRQGGTLLINVENNNSWSLFNIFSVIEDFDLTVYLPPDSMLDAYVHCTSGNIDVTDMQFGAVEFRRTSGNMNIRGCTAKSFLSDVASGDTEIELSSLGSMNLTCRSGETEITDTKGSIYARATSGSIDIANATGALDVACISGNISIDVSAMVSPITAGLTSGNIRIYMPADAAFDLEARTTSGNISSGINIQVSGSLSRSFAGDEIYGKCNGGGPLVSVTVTSGNIDIIAK